MKNILKIFLFSIVLLFIFSLNVEASAKEAYNVMTSPGADSTKQMNINYHSDIEGTFVQYTKIDDTNYSNATTVYGECAPFSVPATQTFNNRTVNTTGFTERNVCTVSLDNLDSNTKYMFRVGKTTFTVNHFFQTGSGIAPFSFLYFTDPQYGNAAQAQTFNNLMTTAMGLDNDIRFSLVSGDMVDRAGIMNQWDILFQQSNIKNMPIALAPGNHEYYDASSTPVFFDATYYNAFFNNPKNGAAGILNSSFYFKYNNVLVVSIDSEASALSSVNLKAQQDWFEQVMKTNHAQYIIVSMHRSFYGSTYASVGVGLRAAWQPLFDKYGVDLVVGGHDHLYSRTKRIYQGVESTDPNQGTTYLIGGAAGSKFYPFDPIKAERDGQYDINLLDKTFTNISTVTIIKVDAAGLHLNTVNQQGQSLDTITLGAKRASATSASFNREDYINTITLTADKNNRTQATLNWGSRGYGYINSVKLTDSENNVHGYNYLNTSHYMSYTITGLEENKYYGFELEVSYKDGTTETKPISLSTKLDFGRILNVHFDDSTGNKILYWVPILQNNQVSKYRISVNDELYEEVLVGADHLIMNNLSPYRLNEVYFEAIDIYDDVVFSQTLTYGEAADPVDISFSDDEINLKVGEDKTLTLEVSPPTTLNITYSSSDEEIATVDQNGKVTALKVGEVIITAEDKDRDGVNTTVKVIVQAETTPDPDPDPDPDPNPDPKDPPKKGCFGTISIYSFGLMAVGLLVLRKRKF